MMRIVKIAAIGMIVFAQVGASAMAGDAAKGKKLFSKCKTCHTIDKGGKNKIGPNLFGVVGRKAGTVDGFNYSGAMKEAGVTWDAATLDKFLEKPKSVVKGTKMIFPGFRKADQRADMIAYLKKNGG